MALLNFKKRSSPAAGTAVIEAFLDGYSIEVMPRTAEKVEDFRALLPAGTRVYIAHIEGTAIDDMVATAKRLNADGFPVMPHFPARIITDKATLADWIARYQGEADVKQALLLAGGVTTPRGDYDSSMQLLDTGFSTRPASPICTSPGTRKATAISTLTAPPRTSMRRWPGSRGFRNRPTRRWQLPRSLRSRPHRSSTGPTAWSSRDHPARPHRHRRPRKAANDDQIRHRLRCRPITEGSAKARDGRLQAAAAL